MNFNELTPENEMHCLVSDRIRQYVRAASVSNWASASMASARGAADRKYPHQPTSSASLWWTLHSDTRYARFWSAEVMQTRGSISWHLAILYKVLESSMEIKTFRGLGVKHPYFVTDKTFSVRFRSGRERKLARLRVECFFYVWHILIVLYVHFNSTVCILRVHFRRVNL